MRQVSSEQLGDFATIYDEDVELVSVTRPQASRCDTLSTRLIGTSRPLRLSWMQKADDSDAPASELPATIDSDARSVLCDEIAAAGELLGALMDCEQVGVRLETLSSPMCPRFHVDHVPCRMLVTLSGAGTEWIRNADVDWAVFADRDATGLPVRESGQVQQLTTGCWSILKGGAWDDDFGGVVHRSPHAAGERLLLSLDPIY